MSSATSNRPGSYRIALGFTKALRAVADAFVAKRYGHRAIVLEIVAAVPGKVGTSITHLRCLRGMCDDDGWIRILMEEAENERMHWMTFIEVAQPSAFERFIILAVQWVFYIGFLALYLVSPATAHRVVGCFEGEAVFSYSQYLAQIEASQVANIPAPAIARHYWMLPENATLRDVVLVVRANEVHHRDVNHGFANTLAGRSEAGAVVAPYPQKADPMRRAA